MDLITDRLEYDILYSKLEEQSYLKLWMNEPEVRRWYPVSNDKDVEDMTKNWIGFSRFGASLTATYEDQIVGIATLFLMPYRKLLHESMIYFVVDPNFTNRGVGTSLVRNVTHLGKTYFCLEKIYIEVYEGCPALSILQKYGYEILFEQENFVKEKEGFYLSRIILEKDLTK